MGRNVKCEVSFGMVWFAGWLFSLGYLQMGFFKGLLAILLWPYYIGVAFATG